LLEIGKGNNSVWKIAEQLSWSRYYRNTIYQVVRNLENKELVEIHYTGKRHGLTVILTEKGLRVLNDIEEAVNSYWKNKIVDGQIIEE
jgi:DNA-binding PadR family transcriptional regulator